MKIQVNSEKNLLSDITAYINMNIIIERFTGKPFYVYTVGCLGVGRSSLGWKRVSVCFKSFQESIEVVSKHYEKGRHGSGSGFTIQVIYIWYFSLAISYKIGITERGDIELTSFRRVVRVNAEVIGMVEGPKWAIIPYGFVRFRLEREKAYMFCCITDADFEQFMQIMKAANPEVVVKGM
jgi:hypothetical protein